jgi:hypothetical protein
MAATWPVRKFLAGATARDPITLGIVSATIALQRE